MTVQIPQTHGLLSANQTLIHCKDIDLKMQKELEIMHESDTLETISIPNMPGQGGILMTFFLQHGLSATFLLTSWSPAFPSIL